MQKIKISFVFGRFQKAVAGWGWRLELGSEVEWRAKPGMKRSDTAEADSLGLCGGRDKQDVECSVAQRRSTELRFQGGSLGCGEWGKALSS